VDFDLPKQFSPDVWQALVSATEHRLETGRQPRGDFWELVVDDANERLEAEGQEVDIDDIETSTRRDLLASAGYDVGPELADLDDDGLAGLEPAVSDYEHDDLGY
jgi:hypothetical protein